MIDVATIKIGEQVHYMPDYMKKDGRFQNGVIKEIPGYLRHVRVVFNCAGDWENYANYTSQLTDVKDLYLGWKHDTDYRIQAMAWWYEAEDRRQFLAKFQDFIIGGVDRSLASLTGREIEKLYKLEHNIKE